MKTYTVVIIGSGFGGQCAAIQLNKMGVDDYIILERRTFAGGTWFQNSYPGAQVDVHSPLYSFSFEPYDWSRLFAYRDELTQYTEHIFNKYNLLNKIRTNSTVTKIEWINERCCWKIDVNDKLSYEAQFVINASGPLSTPIIPHIKNNKMFEGSQFHTNEWDHKVELSNKTVAIMGSGASAAQIIPEIVGKVKHLHVFQRTPHWVLPRNDWIFKKWQRQLLGINTIYHLVRKFIYWSLELRILAFKYSRRLLGVLGTKPALKHLHQQIQDPALREILMPDFTIGCKRIIVSNTLYPSLARENVTVHSRDDSINSFTADGIVTTRSGHIPIDTMIYATGFDATDGIISYPVVGKGGSKLHDRWADYPRAYLGTSIPDFPNLFIVTGPNTGIGHTSAIFIIESQMKYIMTCINNVMKTGKVIEVTNTAENQYTEHVHQEMQKTVWHNGGCNSWYKSKSGRVTAMFPGFSFSFRRLCRKFNRQHHKIY